MAPRVQNRRSATESNPPNTGTLLAGEIAINTNATTANIHFEDAGGDVRSVGADPAAVGKYLREVSAINGVGEWVAAQAGAIIDNDPPAEDDREDGTLWFRPENQTLWVWDETNSTWAPAVPQVPAGGGGDYAAGELREQVFFNNEQTVDNDYTIESTVNSLSAGPITLDADATVTIEDGGSWTVVGGAGQTIDPTGFWGRSGTTLSPATPGDDLGNIGNITAAGSAEFGSNIDIKYADGTPTEDAFRVFIGSSRNVKITSAGKAEFGVFNSQPGVIVNGEDGTLTAAGDLQVGGDSYGNEQGVVIGPEGFIRATYSGNNDVFRSYQVGNTTVTCSISANGSAEFALNGVFAGGCRAGALDGDSPASGAAGSNLGETGTVSATADGRNVWEGRKTGSNFLTSKITSDGTIQSGGDAASGNKGVKIIPSTVYACNIGSNAIWRGYQQGSGSVKSEILGDGNATFVSTRSANVFINLEHDNPDSWKVTQEEYEEDVTGPLGKVEKTVTKTREVREYVGPVLSVLDELQALRARATQQDAVIAQLVTALRSQGAQIDTTDLTQEAN